MGQILGGAAITAGGTLLGTTLTASGSRRAADLNYRATMAALEDARREREMERQRYEREEARLDQAWAAEQARRAPYRNAALSILGDYGFNVTPEMYQPTRPEGWLPGEGAWAYPGPVDRNTRLRETGFDAAVPRRTPTVRRTPSDFLRD